MLTRACPRLNGRLALAGVSLVGCGGRGRRLADWVQARQRLDFGRRDESAFQRAAALGETRTDDALAAAVARTKTVRRLACDPEVGRQNALWPRMIQCPARP